MNVRTQVALLAAVGLAPRAFATAEAPIDEVSAIEVRPSDVGGSVVLHGSHPPIFSVFRLTDPDRVVVDLAGADVSKTPAARSSGIKGLGQISAVQFEKSGTCVGRVVLSADASLAYNVKVTGNDVVIALSSGDPARASAGAREDTTPVAQHVEAVAAGAADDHLIDKTDEHGNGGKTGKRIFAATSSDGPLELSVRTDGPVGDMTVLRLRNPNRIAIDLVGFEAKGAKAREGGMVSAIRFGKSAGGTRVVFDLSEDETPRITWTRGSKGLSIVAKSDNPKPPPVVTASKPVVTELAVSAKPQVSHETQVVIPTKVGATPKQARLLELHDIRVTGDSTNQEVVLELPLGAKVGLPKSTDGSGYELALRGIAVPEKLRRTLDATAFGGPVSTVSSFNGGGGDGRIVVASVGGSRQEIKQDGSTVTWRFSRSVQESVKPVVHVSSVGTSHTEEAQEEVAGFTTAATDNASELPKRAHYTGRRISLEFKDIDIQNLLRLFADISHKNVLVADNVKGRVTISLRNVPWDQAFELILKTHALGREESGNIIRVAPEEELEKERRAALEAKKARDLLEPLRVRLIPVNYALAGEVSDKIKDVLSERGVVTVDSRTNVLIVKDVPESLAKAEGMVRNLDTQTPEVLIESRIVEASTQFTREIGIQWGGNATAAPAFGNATGLVFPSVANVAGAAGGTGIGTATNPNFAVNLPAAIGPGSGGGLGFIFGSAGGAVNLNLRISALENNGVVKTVSAPKIATIDNTEATISQGVSIPFAQVSAAGVQTAFIEARLELKVTPHVTSDGSILLKISATNNQPNSGITGANGQPSISRKEAKTNMLVRDGDTTVIGGIYTRQTGVQTNQVPLFGSIPILGWLFKHKLDSDQRTELLVFITPRILNRQQIVASGN